MMKQNNHFLNKGTTILMKINKINFIRAWEISIQNLSQIIILDNYLKNISKGKI